MSAGETRRRFLEAAGLLALAPRRLAAAEQIIPGLTIVRGAVNTAVFERNGRKLLIDSGELESVPSVDWILFTHHHPDHASNASRLTAAGAKTIVPAAERQFFEDAYGVWDGAEKWLEHDQSSRPELVTLRDPVPVTRALRDGETHDWQGLRFEVLETPGHTDGSLTYVVELEGKRIAFTGDLIYGPGQIHDIHSLQKAFAGMKGGYWGFGGAIDDVKSSLDKVLSRQPDLLIPSHGIVIRNPVEAVAQLKQRLDAVMENYLTTCAWRANGVGNYTKKTPAMLEPTPPVPYPKWCRNITFTSKALVADDGSIFLSDCGNERVVQELEKLSSAGEIGKVDALWLTHYHDDHTSGVNLARKRFGMPVYAQAALVDVLEHPRAYQLPALFGESIHVDRVLKDGEQFEWKGFKLTAYDFPGQTLYHAGLLVERAGHKVFFSGDCFSNRSFSDVCSQNRNFSGRDVGFEKCCRMLLEIRPDLLMTAHWGPLAMPESYLKKFIDLLQAREQIYRKLFPYDDPNFGTDPYWVRAYPFRQHAQPGALVEIEARVMNHAAKPRTVRMALNLQQGWRTGDGTAELVIPPHTEGRLRLSATAPEKPTRSRQVLGLCATVADQRLGECAAAIVDLVPAPARPPK